MEKSPRIQNILILVLLTGLVALAIYVILTRQYNKGVEAGKNDPAVKVESINLKKEEVREGLKKVVEKIDETFTTRERELELIEKEVIIVDPSDPAVVARLEDPEQGISEEMYLAINKARAEANRD